MPDQIEPCELGAYLGRADPWYESNVNTLCHMIPKLATMVGKELFHLLVCCSNSNRVLVCAMFLKWRKEPEVYLLLRLVLGQEHVTHTQNINLLGIRIFRLLCLD